MGILNIHLNNINLDDTNYDKDDLDTINHVRFLAWHSKFEKHKALMPIAWLPKRWSNFCVSEE